MAKSPPMFVTLLFIEAERECRVNPMGTGYVGTANRSASGEPCMTWSDTTALEGDMLLDLRVKESRNYCRNILGPLAFPQPVCALVTPSASIGFRLEPCDIKFCG